MASEEHSAVNSTLMNREKEEEDAAAMQEAMRKKREQAQLLENIQQKAQEEVWSQIIGEQAKDEANERMHAEIAAQVPAQKRKRGRPKKDAGPPVPPPAAHRSAGAVPIRPSPELTDEGREAKRTCLALMRRLGSRLDGFAEMPSHDTDEGWKGCLAAIQNRLGEAAAEVNVKGLFLVALGAYERVSLAGRFNPLGWDTSGITERAQEPQNFQIFEPDLVELSIIYGSWFSSGPAVRLLGNTVQHIARVAEENAARDVERMQAEYEPPKEDKFASI